MMGVLIGRFFAICIVNVSELESAQLRALDHSGT